MEVDTAPNVQALPLRPQTTATILCCNCGAPIDGTSSAGALCYDCVKLTIDISEGIQREGQLHTCRDCNRWSQPPNQWVMAQPESRELLALCLRRLKGLNKVRIIDASFIWTEPHSRRVKVKISIQQEVFQGTIIQQTFDVEFVVYDSQCPDCKKSYTHHSWRASVQVRQHVPHKRSFLVLEQLILKHNAHRDTINIKEVHEGLDFFFAQQNHAEKFLEFLTSVAPVTTKKSKELISEDSHTNKKSYKFSYSATLVPICKDDLVALPIKIARQQLGNITPLVLCHRVGTSVNLLDPSTLQTTILPTPVYWRSPFKAMASIQELVEFIVMDIEPSGLPDGHFLHAEATVARASDLGVNDTTYFTRTHLGGILHPGDSVMGYHLTNTNLNNEQFDAIRDDKKLASTIPDVMLVKKYYPRKKKSGKSKRNWRVKRMDRDEASDMAGNKKQRSDQEKMAADFEMFLQEVEEDKELQSAMALYKAEQEAKNGDTMEMASEMDEDGDGDEDSGLQIPMEQLLDEFEDMNVEEDAQG